MLALSAHTSEQRGVTGGQDIKLGASVLPTVQFYAIGVAIYLANSPQRYQLHSEIACLEPPSKVEQLV